MSEDKKKGFDLGALTVNDDAEEGKTIQVYDPSDGTELEGFKIKLIYTASKAHERWSAGWRKRNVRAGKLKGDKQGEFQRDCCVHSLVVGWEGALLDGTELDCNDINKKKLFAVCPWLVEQVYSAADDIKTFRDEVEGN